MSPSLWKKESKCLWFMTLWVLWFGALFPGLGWAENLSGLDLKLYTLQEGHKYPMGQPISLIAVLKNVKKWPINTDPITELEHFFVATDPTGVKHTPLFEERQAADMPPTYRWGGFDTAPAEVLDPGSKRSVIIDDVTVLFPIMKQLSGWYTLQVRMPGSRYGWTVKTKTGQVGVLDDKAWHGVIRSNELRIFVAPARGGRLKVRVEDLSTPESAAKGDLEVRVFEKISMEEKKYGLEEVWEKLEVVAQGKTGIDGWVILPPGSSCLPEPQADNAYVAVAKYGGEYEAAYFEAGAEGWNTECGGLLRRYILFNKQEQQFSVFGLNSVWVRNKARIESGDVGVQKIGSEGPWLVPEFEVSVAQNAWLANGCAIKADTVEIRSTSSVYEVYCNEVGTQIDGKVRLEEGVHYSLTSPVWEGVEGIFDTETFEARKQDVKVTVDSDVEQPLSPSSYSDVSLSPNAVLRLSGGTYDFMNLSMGSDSRIVCDGQTKIRIRERLSPGSKAYIGPAADSGLSAKDVIIYVNGENGKKGGIDDKPWAAEIGEGNTIKANIYAKNGTLLTGEGCVLEGSFIAKDLVVGMKAVVHFDGAFE